MTKIPHEKYHNNTTVPKAWHFAHESLKSINRVYSIIY